MDLCDAMYDMSLTLFRALAPPAVPATVSHTTYIISLLSSTVVASCCYCCRVWDMESGQLRSTLEGHTEEVTSMALSPDGRTLVSGSLDKTIR